MNRHHLIAADTGQRSDPPSGRNQQYQCGASAGAGSGPDPAQCDPDFDRRTDPLQKGGQERSGDSSENGIGRNRKINLYERKQLCIQAEIFLPEA